MVIPQSPAQALGALASASPLVYAAEPALRCGAQCFELLVLDGGPRAELRLTLDLRRDRAAVWRAMDLAPHPWGPADWLGLRFDDEGRVHTKPYHAGPPRDRPHPGPLDPTTLRLRPTMSALWPPRAGDPPCLETYLRHPGALSWTRFVARIAAPLGPPPPEPPFALRLRDGTLGLSLREIPRGPPLLTLFVGAAALPPEAPLADAWAATLSAPARDLYAKALAVATLAGAAPARLHAGIALARTPDGATLRAASIHLPPEPLP
jgi:hypothetical protein